MLFSILFIPMMVIPIALFVFWIWMLIDAIKYQKEDKLMWVLLIAFLNLVGAVIYYFVAKIERAKGISKNSK